MAWFDLLTTILGGVRLAPDGMSRRPLRRQGPYIRVAFARRRRHGRVGTGNGVVCQVAQRAARIEVKLQAQVVVPIIVAVAAVDEWGSNWHNVSGHGDHHNHIKEVIRDNNDHSEFLAIRDRLEQPVNRK